MGTPQLWTFRMSPFAGKVRACFAEKGVEVELVEIDPVRRPARLSELNPVGKVPVLEVDGVALRESSVICEWIEETYADPPLWPASAEMRAWARGWAKYVDDAPAANFFIGFRKRAFGRAPEDPEDIAERLHGQLPRHFRTLEDVLGVHDGPWLCGEQFTLADLSAMAIAVRLSEWGAHLQPDPAELPRLTEWFARLRGRPSAAAIDQKGMGEPLTAGSRR